MAVMTALVCVCMCLWVRSAVTSECWTCVRLLSVNGYLGVQLVECVAGRVAECFSPVG